MKIINLDRFPFTLPGGMGCKHDNAVVLSETETELHIITGKQQPKCLFRGTLGEAHAFVLNQQQECKK